LDPSYKDYQAQVIKNAKVMAETFENAGLQ
jgi:glycine hydroxymethyltransferase